MGPANNQHLICISGQFVRERDGKICMDLSSEPVES